VTSPLAEKQAKNRRTERARRHGTRSDSAAEGIRERERERETRTKKEAKESEQQRESDRQPRRLTVVFSLRTVAPAYYCYYCYHCDRSYIVHSTVRRTTVTTKPLTCPWEWKTWPRRGRWTTRWWWVWLRIVLFDFRLSFSLSSCLSSFNHIYIYIYIYMVIC